MAIDAFNTLQAAFFAFFSYLRVLLLNNVEPIILYIRTIAVTD